MCKHTNKAFLAEVLECEASSRVYRHDGGGWSLCVPQTNRSVDLSICRILSSVSCTPRCLACGVVRSGLSLNCSIFAYLKLLFSSFLTTAGFLEFYGRDRGSLMERLSYYSQ